MKPKTTSYRKRLLIVAAALLGLLAAVGLSQPGRAIFRNLLATVGGSEPSAGWGSVFTFGQSQDFEQRARARHGWNAALVNSVLQGTATFYTREGGVKRQATLRLARKYPDRLRVDLDSGRVVESFAVNQNTTWKTGEPNLSEAQARDLRAWLRLFPERLFLTRGAGALYRESGKRVEDYQPVTPWAGRTQRSAPLDLEQVEVTDTIATNPEQHDAVDRRKLYYYIERTTATIHSIRWMEVDDPTRSPDDANAAKTDIRIDFSDWRTVDGVLWPFEVVRWVGGRVDLRIQLSQVQTNQPMPDTLFRNELTRESR